MTNTITADSDALEVLSERHECRCTFNVMPDHPVEEVLKVSEYRVGPRYVEAHFDREYTSSMRASPSHLVFLTALAHTQKMLYVLLCREFGFDYEPDGVERFKMWPTKIDVRVPKLIAEERGLIQQLWVRSLKTLPNGAMRAVIESRIDSMQIRATVPVFLLEGRSAALAPGGDAAGIEQGYARGASRGRDQ